MQHKKDTTSKKRRETRYIIPWLNGEHVRLSTTSPCSLHWIRTQPSSISRGPTWQSIFRGLADEWIRWWRYRYKPKSLRWKVCSLYKRQLTGIFESTDRHHQKQWHNTRTTQNRMKTDSYFLSKPLLFFRFNIRRIQLWWRVLRCTLGLIYKMVQIRDSHFIFQNRNKENYLWLAILLLKSSTLCTRQRHSTEMQAAGYVSVKKVCCCCCCCYCCCCCCCCLHCYCQCHC